MRAALKPRSFLNWLIIDHVPRLQQCACAFASALIAGSCARAPHTQKTGDVMVSEPIDGFSLWSEAVRAVSTEASRCWVDIKNEINQVDGMKQAGNSPQGSGGWSHVAKWDQDATLGLCAYRAAILVQCYWLLYRGIRLLHNYHKSHIYRLQTSAITVINGTKATWKRLATNLKHYTEVWYIISFIVIIVSLYWHCYYYQLISS